MSDTMKIEILADGSIKTTTDPISAPNHSSAESFLKDVRTLAGGTVTRKARGKHQHVHHHEDATHSH
jgi:hypothetical protein